MRTQLHRALSKLGYCSRNKAMTLIREGEVYVNGSVVISPLMWIDIKRDKIVIQRGTKKEIPQLSASSKVYYALHKPKGYVTTREDERGRKTIYDLLPSSVKEQWIFPVGRLDKDSEGLLLLTNDGSWSQNLLDPNFHVEKEYLVWLDKDLAEENRVTLEKGILVKGKKALPCMIHKRQDCWSVILHEGRNRQVRKMFAFLGYRVVRLLRIRIGLLKLGKMKAGEIKMIKANVVGKNKIN